MIQNWLVSVLLSNLFTVLALLLAGDMTINTQEIKRDFRGV
jgi:hypothetical protein